VTQESLVPKYRELDSEQQAQVRESFDRICKEKDYEGADKALLAYLLGITDAPSSPYTSGVVK
jgi:hypothetical protein